ncbi:MAG: efflux RND transporter periplasmic adaptor subunit [Gammaproteobacteria bacterium]|nr:efflux RND transporter periplasmic adaptor subunit [Gammaproteobacteria bacterium]
MLKRYLRKKKSLIAIVLVLIALGFGSYEWMQPAAVPMVTPVTVTVMPATEQNLPLAVTALGNLIAPQGTMLKSQQAGVIQSILFQNGQNVKLGQLLLQLHAQSEQAAYDEAEATLVNAKSLYDRYMSLNKEDPDVLSKMQIDQQYATYQEALATLAGMKKSLDDMQIRAPFTGTMGSTNLSVGSYVNAGDSVVAIINRNDLEVVYQVPETDYALVKQGQAVHLTVDSYPGETFSASVDYLAPLISATSHSFTVRAKLLNPKGLSPGMLMHVTHVLQPARQVLSVPTLSLVSELSGFGVYEVVNHKVVEQFVQIGIQYQDQTAILSGLTPGAMVIVGGQEKVEPGQTVTAIQSQS